MRPPQGTRWLWAWMASAFVLLLGANPNRAADDAVPYSFISDELDSQFNFMATLRWNAAWSPQAEARIAFNFKDAPHHYYLSITRNAAQFFKVDGKNTEKLGTPATFDLPANGEARITLQRRAWRMSLIWNGQVIAEAFDDEFTEGRLGFAMLQATVNLTEPRYQPTEDAEFADDFMRTQDATGGEWEPLLGRWNYSGLQGSRADPNRSPNPFTYRGLTDESEQALSVAGRWFWDSYSVSASVKPEMAHAVGLCAYVQDGRNYLAFKWTNRDKKLVRVVNGQQSVLTTAPGGFMPRQWYRLELRVSGGHVIGMIDGLEVLSARDVAFGQGKVGLLVEKVPQDRRVCAAHFDDVKVKMWTTLMEDFAVASAWKWKDLGAHWRTDTAKRQRVKFEPDAGLSFVGEKEWTDYQISAVAAAPAQSYVGLCFGYQDENSYYLFWCPTSGNAAPQLLQMRRGERRSLAQGAAQGPLPMPLRLRVEVQEGYVRAFADEKLSVELYVSNLPPGKVGIYADSPSRDSDGASFSDVRVSFDQPQRGESKVPERFAKDGLMKGWSTSAGAWKFENAAASEVVRFANNPVIAQGVMWHKGDFFADPSLSFPCPYFGPGNRLMAVLYGSRENAMAGYVLTITGAEAADAQRPTTTKWELSVNGAVAQTVQRNVPPDSTVRFSARGAFVSVSYDDTSLLTFQGAPPKRGTKIGLRLDGATIDLSKLSVDTPNQLDYTFSSAPVDWWAQKGIWEVTERWTCGPQWSFFGGVGAVNPVLWSKPVFEGDLTVEIYAATPMDPARGERSPAEINLTICGNGTDLSSGYSFIFAGANQTLNRIYRGDEIVAQQPFVRVMSNTHQGWFYVRVEKSGGQLRFFANDKLILEYNDPHPLRGGRVAFWSYNGGISLARVRLWYERLGQGNLMTDDASRITSRFIGILGKPEHHSSLDSSTLNHQSSTVTAFEPTNDFETDFGSWTNKDRHDVVTISLDADTASRGKRSLKIQNVTSGGDFTVWATRQPFDAEKFPVIRFDYKIPADVRVNFYARIKGIVWEIGFTAPRDSLPAAHVTAARAGFGEPRIQNGLSIGTIDGVIADDRWHSATFDLLAAIRRANLDTTIVEELAFASPNEPYLRCGFGGNHLGATYHLDNFRLEAAKL